MKKKRLFLLFFCFFIVQSVHSEDLKTFDALLAADSLAILASRELYEGELNAMLSRYLTTEELNSLNFDQIRISALFWAAKIQADSRVVLIDPDKNYLLQSEALAVKKDEVDFLVHLLNKWAKKYYNEKQWDNAFSFYHASYELIDYIKEDENKIDTFLGLAKLYQHFAYQQKAVDLLLKASEIPALAILKEKKYDLLVSLGTINYEIEYYEEAIHLFNQAIKISKQRNDVNGVLHCYKEIARTYKKQENYDAAISTLFLAKNTPSKGISFQQLASYDREIGETYLLTKKYKKAENHLILSLDEAKRYNDKALEAKSLLSIGRLFVETNELEKAKNSLMKSIRIADSLLDRETLLNAYWVMSKLFEKQHLFSSALKYLTLYTELKNTIGYEEAKKEIISKQLIFYRESNEKIIKNLEQENEKMNTRFWLALAIIALFSILTLIVIWLLTKKNQANKELQKSNHKLNEARIALLNKKEQLKDWNIKLEQQVVLRTAQLKEANERLLVLDKAKSEFLEIISNDMRTPLSGIIGITQLLNQTFATEDQKEYLNDLTSASKQLLHFSEVALLITTLKIKNDQNEFQQILVSYIIDSLEKQTTELLKKNNIQLKAHITPENLLIFADSFLIIRSLKLLIEFISNNTESNGTIEINISGKATYNSIQIIAESKLFDQNELDAISALKENNIESKSQSKNLTIAAVRLIQEIHNGAITIDRIDPNHFEIVLIFPKQT